MQNLKLCESEYRLSEIVWENEPLKSSDLAKKCYEKLGWKKSTTYTILKKLIDKGVLQNKDTMVTSLISCEYIRQIESRSIVDKIFAGSLPKFIASFADKQPLTNEDVAEIEKIILEHVNKDSKGAV